MGFIFTRASPLFSQSVISKPGRFRFSYEEVGVKENPSMGLFGVGYDFFPFNRKAKGFYFGINSYSSVKGKYSGLFSFGVAVGWRHALIKNSLLLDLNGFIGGGGGGGAPDGGGLILRPNLSLEKRIGDLGVRLGYSQIEFPFGEIGSSHFSLGVSFNTQQFFGSSLSSYRELEAKYRAYRRFRVTIVNTYYYNSRFGSFPERKENSERKVKLIGVQFDRFFTPNLYASVEFNGVYSGGIDGFMSYLLGVGGHYPFTKSFFWEGRVLGGPSGGGGVKAGGGASIQVETGLGVNLGENWELKFLLGETKSIEGDFHVNHFDITIGKSFYTFFTKQKLVHGKPYGIPDRGIKTLDFSLGVFNRSYLPPKNEETKTPGETYNSLFNLVGLEGQMKLSSRWRAVGSTLWAYQGEYGAYGEGWLGLSYVGPLSASSLLEIKVQGGAGGGAGLRVGSGLLFQYSVGFEKRWRKGWSNFVSVGQMRPYNGNFTPFLVDLGVRIKMKKIIIGDKD